MISLPDRQALLSAATMNLPADLHAIVDRHIRLAVEGDLLDLTHIVVVQSGDTGEALTAELGFSPLVHPIDGTRFGEVGFQPYWDWLADLGGWYELVITIGNSGFAFLLIVEDRPNPLRVMCSAYVRAAGPPAKTTPT